jgi:hypothetical protein
LSVASKPGQDSSPEIAGSGAVIRIFKIMTVAECPLHLRVETWHQTVR